MVGPGSVPLTEIEWPMARCVNCGRKTWPGMRASITPASVAAPPIWRWNSEVVWLHFGCIDAWIGELMTDTVTVISTGIEGLPRRYIAHRVETKSAWFIEQETEHPERPGVWLADEPQDWMPDEVLDALMKHARQQKREAAS